jgi:hypothetical protein
MLYKTPGYDDTPMKTYKIEVLSERGETVSEQIFTLKGKEIALDFITVNFEYSEIEDGKNMNLAYPYRRAPLLMEALIYYCPVYRQRELPRCYKLLACKFGGLGHLGDHVLRFRCKRLKANLAVRSEFSSRSVDGFGKDNVSSFSKLSASLLLICTIVAHCASE